MRLRTLLHGYAMIEHVDYSQFRKRLQNLGIRFNDARSVTKWFYSQVDANGPEMSLAYLKKVGDGVLWYLDSSLTKPSWVKFKHRFPAGIFCLKGYSEDVLLRVAKFARSITLDQVTSTQRNKVVNGAIDDYNGSSSGIAHMSLVIQEGIYALGLRPSTVSPKEPPLIARQFKKVMSVSGPVPPSMHPPLQESASMILSCPEMASLPYAGESLLPISPRTWKSAPRVPIDFVGEIHASQEGGGKLRMYAAPYTGFQCLLTPIHDWIVSIRKAVLTDCTYDQSKGALWAQEYLKQDITVYSVDLTTATCRFPLEPQLMLLSSLGLEHIFTDALKFMCQGKWKVSEKLVKEGFPSSLSWKVGQPLGIKPSMSMFSLTHNVMLAGLCHQLSIPLDSFRILGDDVVLVNPDLHNAYRSLCDECGIPVSIQKSHASSRFAEFAGYSITRDTMVRAGKWSAPSHNNHLGIASSLGTPLYGEVSKHWLEAQKLQMFSDGTWEPSSKDWSKYLKANTLLRPITTRFETNSFKATSWKTGVHREIISQFGESAEVLPYTFDIKDLFKICDFNTGWLDAYYNHISSDWMSVWDAAIQCEILIHNSFHNGVITNLEAIEMLERVDGKIHTYFWLPPKALMLRESQRTKDLIKALAR